MILNVINNDNKIGPIGENIRWTIYNWDNYRDNDIIEAMSRIELLCMYIDMDLYYRICPDKKVQTTSNLISWLFKINGVTKI